MTDDQIKIANLEAKVNNLQNLIDSLEGGDLFDKLMWLIEHNHACVRFMVRSCISKRENIRDITWTDEIPANKLRDKLLDHLKSWGPSIHRGPIMIENPIKLWSPCHGEGCDHPSHSKEEVTK